eukprot:574925-Pelagomonas_calceolata.AAC.1
MPTIIVPRVETAMRAQRTTYSLPLNVLARPDPTQPPTDPISFAVVSAVSLTLAHTQSRLFSKYFMQRCAFVITGKDCIKRFGSGRLKMLRKASCDRPPKKTTTATLSICRITCHGVPYPVYPPPYPGVYPPPYPAVYPPPYPGVYPPPSPGVYPPPYPEDFPPPYPVVYPPPYPGVYPPPYPGVYPPPSPGVYPPPYPEVFPPPYPGVYPPPYPGVFPPPYPGVYPPPYPGVYPPPYPAVYPSEFI